MGQSVVINPGEDFHPSSQAVVSSEAGDAGVVSKKSHPCVCHFCGRLCRNAQALGGHMNVHRKERALAKQLMELRNQGEIENGKGTTGVVDVVAPAAAAAASGTPLAGEGRHEQDHLQAAEEVITHGGSSVSSSSPPSTQSIAIASTLVHPWRSLHRLPSKNRKSRAREAVDLELRLGFTPGRFL